MSVNTTADHFQTIKDLTESQGVLAAEIKKINDRAASERAGFEQRMAEFAAEIQAARDAIEADLRATGETSLTDPATGINAHFKRSESWKVTSKDELFAAAKERPELGLIVEAVDEKKAVAVSKESGEPLPGIECIQNETFTILPPKAKK
jgi:hypothetical protein